MAQVDLRGNVDPTLRGQLHDAVAQYAAANPGISTADKVVLDVIGADGKPCQVEGALQRDIMGNVIFIVVGIVGRLIKGLADKLRQPRDGKGPNAKREARRAGSRQQAVLERIYNGNLPTDPEQRFQMFLDGGLLEKRGKGFAMAGGLTFPTKAAVLEHLSKDLGNDGSGPVADLAKQAAAASGGTGNGATAPKAVKKAARKAAKAVKKEAKATAKVAKKAAKVAKPKATGKQAAKK